MAINLYIGPLPCYSTTPHANPPTIEQASDNASLVVSGPFWHAGVKKKYVDVQVIVSNCGDNATDVRVRLYATTTSNDNALPSNIDTFVFNLIKRSWWDAEWSGLTIVTPTWTSSTYRYFFPNKVDPMCILAGTLVCPNMDPAGPSIAATTQDQCVGIFTIATGY